MGLSDWENFQPHSLRALFTTRLSNSKEVNDQERMVSCRHTSMAANAIYQEADSTSEANKFAALGIFPKKKLLALEAEPKMEIMPESSGFLSPKNTLENNLAVIPPKLQKSVPKVL